MFIDKTQHDLLNFRGWIIYFLDLNFPFSEWITGGFNYV